MPYLELLGRTVGDGPINLAELLKHICQILERVSSGIAIATRVLSIEGSKLQQRRVIQRASITEIIIVEKWSMQMI
jgi:hypothetical protein